MTMLPPPEYAHPPNIPVIERVMRQEDVDRECHRVMPRAFECDKVARVEGCSQRVVTVERPCVWVVDKLVAHKHELAHHNGWPFDHRGGIADRMWGR